MFKHKQPVTINQTKTSNTKRIQLLAIMRLVQKYQYNHSPRATHALTQQHTQEPNSYNPITTASKSITCNKYQ